MSTALNRSVGTTGILLAYGASLAWFFVFSYAAWLRFSSPTTPDSVTGQVYEKTVRGVFYVTQNQHFWVYTMLLPIWLTAAFGGALSLLARYLDNAGSDGTSKPSAAIGGGAIAVRVLGYLWLFAVILLFFVGDYVMDLIFTGKLAAPPTIQ